MLSRDAAAPVAAPETMMFPAHWPSASSQSQSASQPFEGSTRFAVITLFFIDEPLWLPLQ
jgi:hypothetical protein